MRRFYRQLWMWWIATLLAQSLVAHAQLRFVTVVPAAANTTVPDEDGDFPAYIEIRSLETGILSGHYLTDNPQRPNAWQVPAGYVLAQGQTIRIFASGKDRRPTGPGGVLHTSFTYDCSVPYCGLFDGQQVQVHTFSDRTDRCRCEGVSLLKERTIARTLIPTEDIGLDWTLPGYDDKGWIRGPTGIGYDVGNSPMRPGLILYHTFDKAHVTGATVPDLSGPILHTGSAGGDPAMVQGRVAEAFDFPGVNSRYVLVPHHAELNPGSGHFSVAIWFRPTRSGTTTSGSAFEEVLVSKLGPIQTGSPTSAGWAIHRNANGTFVRVTSAAGTRAVALGTTTVNDWHHAVLVIDRASHQLVGYLDGKRMGSTALASATETFSTLADMVEGRDLPGAAPYAGRLDDVAIWARVLNDAEVAQLFAVGQSGKSLIDAAAFPGGASLYAPLIGTDVLNPMRDVNSSAYIRVPFQVPAVPSIAVGLKLRLHYDDGFVLYLNGAEVARRNAPDPVDYLSAAPIDRPDPVALAGEWIDLSAYVGLLKPGGNLLAFHALNFGADDERFLLAPTRLCLEVVRNPPTGGQCVKETNGRDFWLAFPENYVQEADTPLHLTLCIAGVPQTKGVVEIPGLVVPGFPRAFTIPPSGSLRLTLPRAAELKGPDSLEKKGVHVIAEANVAVYGTSRMDYTTDTFLALPTPCLGVEYWVSSFKNVFDGLPVLNGSQFAVVAVANGTEVTVTPRAAVGVHPAAVPYVVKLDRGETYQLRQEAGQPRDITGTRIVSNKPVGVFGSHRCANIQSVNQFFCDTVLEQLLPVAGWGRTFYVVPLATRKSDTVRVLSASDNNVVTVTSTAGNQVFNLQRGEHKDFVLEFPTRVESSAPSFVTQFSNSSDADHVANADPFMTLIQPANAWLSQYRFCTPPALEFESNYLHLIGPSASVLEIATVNGTPVSAWNPAEVTKGALPGGLAFVRLLLQPGTSYLAAGATPLGMIAYGFSEFDSYGYPGGMRFQGALAPMLGCPPDFAVDCRNVPGATGCVGVVPDLTLRAEAFDDCGERGQIAVTQKPPAGTVLPPGTHPITLVVADASGQTTECVVRFTVSSSWATQQFGANTASNPALEATVWGASADPDTDGLPNAMEEAVGSDPNKVSPLYSVLELATEKDPWGTFPIVAFPRLIAEYGPVVEVEGATALGAPWESGLDIFEELTDRNSPLPGGKYERAVFKIRQPVGNTISNTFYFLRFKLQE